jgi:hypothetical protein
MSRNEDCAKVQQGCTEAQRGRGMESEQKKMVERFQKEKEGQRRRIVREKLSRLDTKGGATNVDEEMVWASHLKCVSDNFLPVSKAFRVTRSCRGSLLLALLSPPI